jgi:hypothetical protein
MPEKYNGSGMRTLVALSLLLAATAFTGSRPEEVPFTRHTLDLGASETCAFADIDDDGGLDIVSGENWYQSPKWVKHKFREAFTNNYVDNFSDLPLDVDGDGSPDIVSCSWFARRLAWWRNPGRGTGEWKQADIETGSSIEFAFLVDLDNDGSAREVLPQFGDEKTPLAWYEARNGSWVKHAVAARSYGHGIGAGDVNGDGRTDIITPKGWLEAPANPRVAALMASRHRRTSASNRRRPCRSIASTRVGIAAFNRLPQIRSAASQSTVNALRTASS